MILFSALWAQMFPASRGRPPRPVGRCGRIAYASQQEWDSTLHGAETLSRLLGRRIPRGSRACAAVAMHFAVSAAAGAASGAAAEFAPQVTFAAGAAFGTALWAVAQELVAPLVGVSPPLARYSAAMQANSLGEHVAYGVVTEVWRGKLRGSA